jgi:hypothetical protein
MYSDMIFMCLLNNGKDYEKLDKIQQIEVQLFLYIFGIINEQFKWEGLPPEIKSYNVEKILNMYGQGVLFRVGEQYAFCNAVNTNMLNIYGEPAEVQPVAINGMAFDRVKVNTMLGSNGEIELQDAVLFKNNLTSTPTYAMIKPLVDELAFIWQSKGINAGLSRVKALIHSNKNLSSSIRQQLKSIIGSSSMIPVVSEKTNLLKEIEKLDFNVEYTPDKYWEDFDKTFATICQWLGITTNLSQNKKERLIVSEVESNDELTTISEDARLSFRKGACEQAKTLFGLGITCENKVPDVKATQPMDNQELEPEE